MHPCLVPRDQRIHSIREPFNISRRRRWTSFSQCCCSSVDVTRVTWRWRHAHITTSYELGRVRDRNFESAMKIISSRKSRKLLMKRRTTINFYDSEEWSVIKVCIRFLRRLIVSSIFTHFKELTSLYLKARKQKTFWEKYFSQYKPCWQFSGNISSFEYVLQRELFIYGHIRTGIFGNLVDIAVHLKKALIY